MTVPGYSPGTPDGFDVTGENIEQLVYALGYKDKIEKRPKDDAQDYYIYPIHTDQKTFTILYTPVKFVVKVATTIPSLRIDMRGFKLTLVHISGELLRYNL